MVARFLTQSSQRRGRSREKIQFSSHPLPSLCLCRKRPRRASRSSRDWRARCARIVTQYLPVFIISFCLINLFSAPQTRAAVNSQTLERRIHIDPPTANGSRYFYVPFEVPARAARVTVAYSYDRANNTNTLDLGLFDARFSGRDEDARGFRGWSGGRRAEIFVAANDATPGYLPGALPTGTWRVIFGLYRVASAGVDVTLRITVETSENAESNSTETPRPTRDAPPSSRAYSMLFNFQPRPSSQPQQGSQRRWFRGDLHMHTVHSDGDWTIEGLASTARAEGLDFISITEHNTSSHHAEIDRLSGAGNRPLVMRGEEVTTYNGHANAWGLPSGAWLDFRVRRGDERRMNEIVAEAHRRGALISINHPTALCGGCDWTYSTTGYDSIEVWNGRWDGEDERALEMWDTILRRGERLTAIGSSDTHRPNAPANALARPTIHVAADSLTERALLEAIRGGRVYITHQPQSLIVNFTARSVEERSPNSSRSVGEELRLARGTNSININLAISSLPDDAIITLVSSIGVLRRFTPDRDGRASFAERVSLRELGDAAHSFIRIEARDRTGAMLLLTNPIYIKKDEG